MKQQIIDLWKISFGDPDDYIRLFFDRVYKEENTFVLRKNGTIVSALQVLPFDMTYCGTTISAGYICGVCTLPSERGKGLMHQLMLNALEEMQHRNYALAILIPATPELFDYYRRHEFTNAFDYSTEEIFHINPAHFKLLHKKSCRDYLSAEKNEILTFRMPLGRRPAYSCIPEGRQRIKLSPDTIYAYYHVKQRARDYSIQHSDYQFETIRRDWMLGNGEIWMAFINEQPVGLAFTMSSSRETLSIREIMYEDAEAKNVLVQSVLNHHQLPKAELRLPPTSSNSIPYGMARIINKEHMIELYRSFHQLTQVRGANLPDFKNTAIPSLTQILLKYERRQAFMNLMMD